MKNALDCCYDHKLDKFILLEDVENKNKMLMDYYYILFSEELY